MAKTVLATHNHVADMAVLPEVHIRATDASCADMDQALRGAWLRDVRLDEMKVVSWIGLNRNILRLPLEDLGYGCHYCDVLAEG